MSEKDTQIKLEVVLDKENDPETVADVYLFLEELFKKKPIKKKILAVSNETHKDDSTGEATTYNKKDIPHHALEPLLRLYETYHKKVHSNEHSRGVNLTSDTKTLQALEDVIRYLRYQIKEEFND